jgi:hypothetical protein
MAKKIASRSRSRKRTAQGNCAERVATIRCKETGQVYALKGYGALKNQYVVKRGIDLSKPIAEQAWRLASRKSSKA